MTPTFHFVGVDTGASLATRAFPEWMAILDAPEVRLVGHDVALNSDSSVYRRLVETLKADNEAIGALVTTHKIDLLKASRDLFDHLGEDAKLLGEVSCLVCRNGILRGYATDVNAAGASLNAMVGPGFFERTSGEVVLLGGGGAGTAIAVHLLRDRPPHDRPPRLTIVDRSTVRIHQLQDLLADFDGRVEVSLKVTSDVHVVNGLLASAAPNSVVINATGMGKDTPGSPLGDDASFPPRGVVWELNYRGQRRFLHQARAQATASELIVADGWDYFVTGWASVIGRVLGTQIGASKVAQMNNVASELREGLRQQ